MAKKKKAIALLITDTHLSLDTIDENISVYNQSLNLALQLGLDKIYHLGDAFESRKAQPLDVLDTFGSKILSMFNPMELGVSIDFIPGNHDKVSYQSEKSYLDQFIYHPGVNIRKEYYSWGVGENKDFIFHQIPFFDEKNPTIYRVYLKQALEVIKEYPKKKHILLTHIGIDGASGNGGHGVANELKKEEFAPFFKVFVGHYHNRSEMGNIFYIGSTDTRLFSEDNEKGACIIYEDGSHEYINFEFRDYQTLNIDLNITNQDELEVLFNRYKDSENYIRFEFSGNQERLNALDVSIYKSVGIDVKKKRKHIEDGIVSASKEEFVSFSKENIESEFEKFSKESKITKTQKENCLKFLKKHLENGK